MKSLIALLLVLALQEEKRPARERPEFVRVEVACTALSGNSVYLDHGREAGFAPGDRVRIFALAGAPRRGKITSVSRTSARVEMDDGLAGLEQGLPGEVWVPRERLEAQTDAPAESAHAADDAPPSAPPPTTTATAEHPPWTAPPEEWNRDRPLLAPAHGLDPTDRPARLDGRVTSALDWSSDRTGGARREFLAGTLALESRYENPFGHGGELDLDAELFARRSDLAGASEDESRLRIDRASYAWGGVRGARDRGEVGRFLQHELPELGFLDGVEYTHELGARNRVGASVGFLPVPDDFFRTGDDLQAALFYRRTSGDEQRFSFAAGYQKTWHEGAADRDLVVGELELHPGPRTALTGSALVDLYTAGDALKGAGPELTQLFVNATHQTEGGHGLGLFLSRFRWPELLRDEFPDLTATEIADAVSTRWGGDGWLALGRSVQLYGRAETWSDQDDSGGGGRVRLTWHDVLARGDVLQLETYTSASKFTDAVGLRASARRRWEHVDGDLSWDATRFDQDGVGEDLLQHALRAGLDFSLGSSWFLALYVESRFGDEQDALALGFLLQRSFDR